MEVGEHALLQSRGMSIFNLIAVLISLVALFSYINDRYFRFPNAIGLMGISLIMSLGIVFLGNMGFDFAEPTRRVMVQANLGEALMQGLLSFLLFAGALQYRVEDLAQEKFVIALLSTVGVAISTFVTGGLFYGACVLIGLDFPLSYSFLFGALISPTDPVAVLAILKRSGVNRSLESKIAGESLFNDGVSVVLFVVLLGIAMGNAGPVTASGITNLILREITGGAIFGLILGWTAWRLLVGVHTYAVEVMITLAVACGGYALAMALGFSGPIAVVMAALVIGNQKRGARPPMNLESFWQLVDELLNSVLFVWIGLAVLAFDLTRNELKLSMLAIPLVLIGRVVSIWAAVTIFGFQNHFNRRAYFLMTWGGLRGGVSVALALSIPISYAQDIVLSVTYVVVAFSILVQGMTLGLFARPSR